jgi:hypothetical protein
MHLALMRNAYALMEEKRERLKQSEKLRLRRIGNIMTDVGVEVKLRRSYRRRCSVRLHSNSGGQAPFMNAESQVTLISGWANCPPYSPAEVCCSVLMCHGPLCCVM